MKEKILHSVLNACALLVKFVTTFAILVGAFSQLASGNQNVATPITVTASTSLEWDQAKGVYIAIGDAFVEHQNSTIAGDKIYVHYDLQSKTRNLKRVTVIGSVIYENGESIAQGGQLDYSIASETYILAGPLASVDGPQGTMTANQTITYEATNPSSKRIVGIGNATYKGADGRVLRGDRVLALLNSSGAVDTIESYGSARIVTPKGIVASSDEFNYDAQTDSALLIGNVEIADKDNILRGARAEVEFDKEISRLLSDDSGKRVTGVLTVR